MTSTALRPEDENLGIASNLLYGLQHVLTMYGGIVAVPLIVGQAAGLSPVSYTHLDVYKRQGSGCESAARRG